MQVARLKVGFREIGGRFWSDRARSTVHFDGIEHIFYLRLTRLYFIWLLVALPEGWSTAAASYRQNVAQVQ
jgi:hypothetical protein